MLLLTNLFIFFIFHLGVLVNQRMDSSVDSDVWKCWRELTLDLLVNQVVLSNMISLEV